jgi:polysaccharide export outer membrane protein
MNFLASLLIACSLAAQTPPAQIQTPPTGKPDTPKPDQPPAHYTLGPGDQLKISVFGEEGMENQIYTIDSDGSITFPLINRIAAGGLTVAEFQDRLKARLADGYIVRPQVAAEIVGYKSQFVFVGGEVRTPARFAMAGAMTLPEALAMAGSPKETASNEVIVTHAKKPGPDGRVPDRAAESIHVNLKDLQLGRAGQDIFLQDGDTVFVPKAQRFYIQGQVKNGASYILEPGMTVQQALALAGGLNERGSDRRISVTRMVDGKMKSGIKLKLTDKVLPDDVIEVGVRIF